MESEDKKAVWIVAIACACFLMFVTIACVFYYYYDQMAYSYGYQKSVLQGKENTYWQKVKP